MINWYPGHMAKTKRLIKENINLIDLVFEVIDARMPISSKIKDIDDLIKTKKRILIATKYDLCDKNITDPLLEQYKNNGYTVIPMDLINGKNISDLIKVSKELMQADNQNKERKGLKTRKIRALIIGIPNVGKSTLINRLVGKKATKVGNRPGITKELSWIRISSDFELLDSPGILWPKLDDEIMAYNLASLSAIKEEILDLSDISIYILKKMNNLYPEQLQERYDLDHPDFNDIEEIYATIAKKVGALRKGAEIDYEKVDNTIINDLKEGRLGKITFDRIP